MKFLNWTIEFLKIKIFLLLKPKYNYWKGLVVLIWLAFLTKNYDMIFQRMMICLSIKDEIDIRYLSHWRLTLNSQ